MPTIIPLLLLGLVMFTLGVLVTLWAVFEVGWMGGDDPMHPKPLGDSDALR